MPLLPSSTQATNYENEVVAQFNYFAKPITIYKEPPQTIVSEPTNLLYGYDAVSQTTNSEVTLSSDFAIYSGLIIYPLKAKNQLSQLIDTKILLNSNSTYIKLTEEGKNYILDGRKNEKLEFDSQTWNFTEANKFQVQRFLGLEYYYFEVKGTN